MTENTTRRRATTPLARRPQKWEPATMTCVRGCGATEHLTAEEDRELTAWLIGIDRMLGCDTPRLIRDGGWVTSGSAGTAWACPDCVRDDPTLSVLVDTARHDMHHDRTENNHADR